MLVPDCGRRVWERVLFRCDGGPSLPSFPQGSTWDRWWRRAVPAPGFPCLRLRELRGCEPPVWKGAWVVWALQPRVRSGGGSLGRQQPQCLPLRSSAFLQAGQAWTPAGVLG